jgi:hypothetical protein
LIVLLKNNVFFIFGPEIIYQKLPHPEDTANKLGTVSGKVIGGIKIK